MSDAGTPTVSDPGGHLIRVAIEAGIRIEPVPGPNAAVAALAASGFPSDTFLFLGFPPIRSKDRKEWMAALPLAGRTVVFYEAPHRIRRTLDEIKHVLGDVPAVIAREMTKTHEELVRGPISKILNGLAAPRGELTVVLKLPQITEHASRAPGDSQIATEFGGLTDSGRLSRQQALAELAGRYQMSRNQVYSAVERGRKSGD